MKKAMISQLDISESYSNQDETVLLRFKEDVSSSDT